MDAGDIQCWDVPDGTVFFCRYRKDQAQLVQMCRELLGKSHGEQSVWYIKHEIYPWARPGGKVVVIKVKDMSMSTQLKLQFT